VWVQESIIGSRFEASYAIGDSQVWPAITGSAFITLEGSLLFDERDPFRQGIRGA
jgi:4-hydroxyproline epimerase